MKFFQVGLLAATFTFVLASTTYNIKLYVEYLPQNVGGPGYQPVDGQFLQAVKVDPDTYLFVLGDAHKAATIQWEYVSGVGYIKDDQGTYFLANDDSLNLIATSNYSSSQNIVLYEANQEKTVFNFIVVNHDYSYIPSKDVGDAIGYSKDHYALVADEDNNPEGAVIHYELLGTDTGNGVGILNPSSITDSIASETVFLETDFYSEVSTTNPPTVAVSTGSASQIQVIDENGFQIGDDSINDTESGGSVSTTESSGSSPGSSTGSSSALASSHTSKTSGSSSHASSTTSEGGASPGASSDKSSVSGANSKATGSASSGSSGSGTTEAKPSSSGASAPSSSASSSTNVGNGKFIAGGAGLLAIFAAVL